MQVQKLTAMRLQKEEASLGREPLANAMVVRDGVLNFHFCLYNLQGPYEGGFYHGVLELHENYPFMAPKLIFYTPNGRFDPNIPICTSFTNYHQETWTSAWNVRTLILATISFMYSEEPSYGCRTDPETIRKEYAANSIANNLKNDVFVRLFADKLREMGKLPEIREVKVEGSTESKEGKEREEGSVDEVASNEAEQNSEGGGLGNRLIVAQEQQPKRQPQPRNNKWKKVFLVVGVVIVASVSFAIIAVKLG